MVVENNVPVSLDQLGRMAGSDRSSLVHGYLSKYERIIGPYLGDNFSLIDITNDSRVVALTWSRYLTAGNAYILTVRATTDFVNHRNVTGIKVDDMSQKSLTKATEKIVPSVVVDDGSHKVVDQLNAFVTIFPRLAPGGAYIIEDLQTSFGGGAESYSQDGKVGYDLLEELSRYLSSGRAVSPAMQDIDSRLLLSIDRIEVGVKFSVVYKIGNHDDVVHVKSASDFSGVEWSWSHSTTAYSRPDSTLINANGNIVGAFERLKSKSPVPSRRTESAVVREVDVLFGGVVIDDSGFIAAQSLNCIRAAKETPSILNDGDSERWRLKTPVVPRHTTIGRVDGTLPVLLKSAWDANYGHWLYDSLSRLALLAECKLHDGVRIVVDDHRPNMRQVVLDSLYLAGFDESCVQFQSFTRPVHFERVLIPGTLTDHPTYKSPEATRYLERIASSINPGLDDRIFVTRNSYTRRRLRNEDRLWPVFETLGFKRIVPEELSFHEQVEIFRGADVVAGNLGAAFSNLAFSPEGVKVLALTTEAMVHDFFYDIVAHKSGTYVGVQGKSVSSSRDMSSDFEIEESDLQDGLKLLLRS